MDDFQLVDDQPRGERWDPLGAPNDDQEQDEQAASLKSLDHEYCEYGHCTVPLERLRNLEEEQELLSQSLCALTTHFAQVQFRLRQIVDAPPEEKEQLLKSLEEFAFRGIPEMGGTQMSELMMVRRCQQKELISKLKAQLRELELYAFESGEAGVPQEVLLERQQVILDELKSKMNLELDEQTRRKLTTAEVRQQVDAAFGQLVNPLRMKEHLVAQLKTQVADLERFIEYLQVDGKQKSGRCACGCAKHSVSKTTPQNQSTGMIERTAALVQMFALLQLGCGAQPFKKNKLKSTMKANHWGDLRARLEVAIVRILELVVAEEKGGNNLGDYNSDNESPTVLCSNVKLTAAVRKHLANSIRDLMQHGAVTVAQNQTIVVPFMGCFSKKGSSAVVPTHAWDIVLEYYQLKNGERYNSTPARKLSESFNLDMTGNMGNSNKQNLLSAIGGIIATHTPYKRSYDSHFKAFICAALNANKLVPWLNLIFQCRHILHTFYQPWSYVVKTGFQDGLQSLDALTHIKFDLPVDLAVRQFQNIKDVFT